MTLAIAFAVIPLLFHYTVCAIADPALYNYEVGPVLPIEGQILYNVNPQLYQGNEQPNFSSQILNHRVNARQSKVSPPKVPIDTSHVSKSLTSEINEVIEALNQLSDHKEDHDRSRAAERGNDYGYSPYSQPPPYGYPSSPGYGPWSTPYEARPDYSRPEHASSKISLLKPDLIVKPVATKMASKVSGLIGLGLSLLTGSAPDDLELKGFKDIVINGIVKPLLLAKGGIKSLISKLSIPVISLLLINLEVLVTIWWLWEEDCPQPSYGPPAYNYPKPAYSSPPYHAPSYNSYNNY